MISFYSETNFELEKSEEISQWISKIISNEKFKEGEISYIFCNDAYLHKLNVEFLNHDTLTDIISFDNSIGKQINGDIYISIDRVQENSNTFKVLFNNELHRVMIHGILHYLGYKDKTDSEILLMREKEEQALSLRKFN